MTKKQPAPAPATDEWGIYDPSKAGMQALYSRLGRPILRASEKSERRARRREGKSDRPADGVGLAIEEAKRRAGIIAAGPTAPPIPELPVATAPAPAPVVTVAPVAPVAPASPPPAAPVAKTTRAAKAKTAKTSKRKLGAAVSAAGARLDAASNRRTAVPRPAATPALPPPAPAPAPAPAASAPAPRRAARKTPKAKPAATAAVVSAPAVPSPSPRRPRGPVPLAAWAHAVSDTRPEPKRAEGKGLWRGIFRIPSEVALVEYGRGCRIHRLVIEAASAPLDDPL
jgi:hypothetical protein